MKKKLVLVNIPYWDCYLYDELNLESIDAVLNTNS